MHQGGVPLDPDASLAIILSCRRSHSEMVPSILLVRKTFVQLCFSAEGSSAAGSWVDAGCSVSMTGSMRPLARFPFGDSSPKSDSRSLLLPNELRLRSWLNVGADSILGGEGAGKSGTDEVGRKHIDDNWPVWLTYDREISPVSRSHS